MFFDNLKEYSEDFYFMTHGYDMNKIEDERKQKKFLLKEREKANRALLPVKWKIIIIIFCSVILFLNIAELIIASMNVSVVSMIVAIVNIMINIITIVCAAIKNKKSEKASIIGVVLIICITIFIPSTFQV